MCEYHDDDKVRAALSRRGFLRNSGLVGAGALALGAVGLPRAAAAQAAGQSWRPDPESPRFTLVVMPDTQYMFDDASIHPEPVDASLRYILDRQVEHNIVFLSHLGDLTEHGLPHEMAAISESFTVLDAAGAHYLVDEAPQRNGGIDYQAILDNPVRFHPLATDAVTGSVVDMHPFLTSRAAVRDALRATMGLPLVTGRAVCLGGRRLFDGGLAEAIPFRTPSRQGATHILLLRTRRSDQLTTKASWGERLFVASYLALRGRGALRPWATRYRRGLADEQELTGLCDADPDDISVAQIRPPSTAPTVPRTSRDPVLLAEAIQIGLDAAHKEFEVVS